MGPDALHTIVTYNLLLPSVPMVVAFVLLLHRVLRLEHKVKEMERREKRRISKGEK